MIDTEKTSIQTRFIPRTATHEQRTFSPHPFTIEGRHISNHYFSDPAPSRKTIYLWDFWQSLW
jgi:hypothetical protein